MSKDQQKYMLRTQQSSTTASVTAAIVPGFTAMQELGMETAQESRV